MKKLINHLLNGLFWFILRLLGIDCTYVEVDASTYEARAVPNYIKSIGSPSAIHMEIAKAAFNRQEQRQQSVLDKAKSLMTLVGVLISVLLATSVAGSLITGTLPLLLMLLISLAVLLTALVILARLLSVGVYSAPMIDEDLANAIKADTETKIYFNSLFVATSRNWAANDFMVDVYRAANRLMLLGIALAAATVLVSLYTQHAKAAPTHAVSVSTRPAASIPPPAQKTVVAFTEAAPTTTKVTAPAHSATTTVPSKASNPTTKK